MVKLILNRNTWQELGSLKFTGFIWKGPNRQSLSNLSDDLKYCANFDDFHSLTSQWTGQFVLVYQLGEKLWIAMDRTRTYPLFYHKNGVVSDDFFELFNPNSKLNKTQSLAFITFGHAFGDQTISDDILDFPAGHCVEVLKGKPSYHKYHTYLKTNRLAPNYQTHQNKLLSILDKVGQHLVQNIDNRPVVIPLSGGFDSRLIAIWLKEHNISNVTCFTYGKKHNNFEWKVSKKVAKTLGFKWEMVDYDAKEHLNQFNIEDFFEHSKFVGQGSSMSYMQEYFAIKDLHTSHRLDPESVFVPGHSLDALAGGHQSETLETKNQIPTIARVILENYGSGPELSTAERKSLLQLLTTELIPNQKYLANSILEEWDFKNRQPKLIINSAQLYKYFGYDFLIPLWDKALMDFFKSIAYEETRGCKLYHDTLSNKVFGKGMSFDTDYTSIVRQNPAWKAKVRQSIPSSMLEKRLSKTDYLNYQILTKPVVKDLKSMGTQPRSPRYSYNHYLCEWYLKKISQA